LELRACQAQPLTTVVGANHKSKTELERISVAEPNRYWNLSGTHPVKPSWCLYFRCMSY
jgi:hypothetical protein